MSFQECAFYLGGKRQQSQNSHALRLPAVRVKKKVKVVGCAPTPHKFFEKNLTKNFFSQKYEMLLYQSF